MYIMYSWPESYQLVGPKVTNWGLIIHRKQKAGLYADPASCCPSRRHSL